MSATKSKDQSRKAYVIRHVAFEDLGLWEAPISTRYGLLRYFQAGIDDLSPCTFDQPELLIVLGGPIGVYEHDEYPFLSAELSLLRTRLENQLPTLGICLGAQLIAAAMDARVYPSGTKEIGWGAIQLTEAGKDSSLRHLGSSEFTVLHWHGDTFDLPARATLLASTNAVKHQAFSVGHHALALQFHVEADPERIESWFIGHACELNSAGIKPSELRAQTIKLPAAARINSVDVLADWLDGLETK
jgi:GMP synthase (glutamine-hydrolysing)